MVGRNALVCQSFLSARFCLPFDAAIHKWIDTFTNILENLRTWHATQGRWMRLRKVFGLGAVKDACPDEHESFQASGCY